MAKWFGNIGFAVTKEIRPGYWKSNEIEERPYYGDIIQNTRRLQTPSDKLNDDINVSNRISVVADPFANENMYAIRCIEFMGTKWKVSNVEVAYPRLILELGGLYNES